MDLMENGKDVNEVLSMPFHYVVEILRDKNKPQEEQSLISAFGG
ncbi:phage tail assembly chaperone GT [Bacillus sp. FJAT-45037]